MHDIIIIGGGPAGLVAAVYAERAGKSALVLEKGGFGGQITYSPKIENYPGEKSISGAELADRLVDQAIAQGADVELEQAMKIEKTNNGFSVTTDFGEHEGKAVIIATGAKHRTLGVPGEERLIGSGISFCATCDGAFYAGKHIAVVGGGNSALVEAAQLSEICAKVTVIQNLAYLTGEKKLADSLTARENVEVIYSTVVKEFTGTDELESVVLKSETDQSESVITPDGVFIAIGLMPDNGDFADVAELDKYGYIAAGEQCTTKTPGVFTAGDCRAKGVRQIATAIADGAVAALAACSYIDSLK